MRRSFLEADFVRGLEGEVLGVCLGFDFCAEHEWGINELQSNFGINTEKLGFEGRRNTKVPEGLIYHEGDTTALIYSPYAVEKNINWFLDGELKIYDKKLVGAWSGNSFGINVVNEHAGIVYELYRAFNRKNGIITLKSDGNPFSNPGLILLDYVQIPEEWKKDAIGKDRAFRKEQSLFKRLEEKSGVFDLLKEKGKGFFSLRVKRLDKEGNPRWWLNPMQQNKYNACWCTTEELKQWAEDKGPIVK